MEKASLPCLCRIAGAQPACYARKKQSYRPINKHGGGNHQRRNQPADDSRQHPEKQPHPIGFGQTPDFEQKRYHSPTGIVGGQHKKARIFLRNTGSTKIQSVPVGSNLPLRNPASYLLIRPSYP